MKINCYKQTYETASEPVVIIGFERFSFAAYRIPLKSGEPSDKWLIAEVSTGLPVQRIPADTIEAAISLAEFELIRRGLEATNVAIQSNRI